MLILTQKVQNYLWDLVWATKEPVILFVQFCLI